MPLPALSNSFRINFLSESLNPGVPGINFGWNADFHSETVVKQRLFGTGLFRCAACWNGCSAHGFDTNLRISVSRVKIAKVFVNKWFGSRFCESGVPVGPGGSSTSTRIDFNKNSY